VRLQVAMAPASVASGPFLCAKAEPLAGHQRLCAEGEKSVLDELSHPLALPQPPGGPGPFGTGECSNSIVLKGVTGRQFLLFYRRPRNKIAAPNDVGEGDRPRIK
jgi:hypothetical protein